MSAEDRFWQALTAVAAIITAIIAGYVAYDLASKGPAPQKILELHQMPFINPMNDLGALGKDVALSLKIRGQSADNFVIGKQWIENAGKSPILPSEFHEKISINVQKPWKILAVENSMDFHNAVPLKWKKIDDTKFEAEPTLLNPGDVVSTNLYLTYTEMGHPPFTAKSPDAKTEWKARIVNMHDFIQVPYYSIQIDRPNSKEGFGGFQVHLYGLNYIFVLTTAGLFFSVYLHLLYKCKLISRAGIPSIVKIITTGFISFAAAESSATYLVPNVYVAVARLTHWMNMPWIIIHIILLLYLFTKSKKVSYGV